ncbi:unnamed protein product [Onchocerca flexuosa]|uniref:Glycosyltransferase n=1 Tax=Onchocerca flexuosa TaxID=387005 RepID=A0A183I5Z6_9BILA|nr:unnamed protein product [Onchocerca flexuosa]
MRFGFVHVLDMGIVHGVRLYMLIQRHIPDQKLISSC